MKPELEKVLPDPKQVKEVELPEWRALISQEDKPHVMLLPEDLDPEDFHEVRIQVSKDLRYLKFKIKLKRVTDDRTLWVMYLIPFRPHDALLTASSTGFDEETAWERLEGELRRKHENEIWLDHKRWLQENDPSLLDRLEEHRGPGNAVLGAYQKALVNRS